MKIIKLKLSIVIINSSPIMIILPIERNSTEAKILHVEIWAPENFYDDAKFGDEEDYADNADK